MTAKHIIDQFVGHITAKDLNAALQMFGDQAVFEDPHYPRPRMQGKSQIEKGLRWGFRGMRAFDFEIIHCCTNADGRTHALETHCRHTLINGQRLDFKQVFIFEFENGLITRLSAYEPYGPHGIAGLLLKLNHMVVRCLRKV